MMPEIDGAEQFVMDATSFLAYLHNDPGGPLVEKVLRHCAQCRCKVKMASVDLLCAYTQIADQNTYLLEEVAALFAELPIETVDFSNRMAAQAAQIYAKHPRLGLGGSSSLYLSQSLGATLLTADQNMRDLEQHCLFVGDQQETHAGAANTLDAPDNGGASKARDETCKSGWNLSP